MGADDYAILTAISWYPAADFNELTGPLNDLRIVEQWLSDPSRGGLPPQNITRIMTPDPRPALLDPDEAQPGGDSFDKVFKKLLTARMALGRERVRGRLYLYFSGHGFSGKSQDRDAEAALYCANATRTMYEHIFGTHYARIAKAWALFAEVVLIMDCCRDAEGIRTPLPRPYRDTPTDDLAADVALLSIYAVPKGGAAQERDIPERGAVHGLMTHALIKMLTELPPSGQGGISGTELRRQLLDRWKTICGDDVARRPEIYLPPNSEMYFANGQAAQGGWVNFTWDALQPAGTQLTLADASLATFAQFDLHQKQAGPLSAAAPLLAHSFTHTGLAVQLKPSFYGYQVSGAVQRQGEFRADGGEQRVQL